MDLRGRGLTNVELPDGFQQSAFVLVTLTNPREKLWGRLLGLDGRGAFVCGILLDSFEDFVGELREGHPAVPLIAFFPMHRVERIEVDRSDGPLPSLVERFHDKTGTDASAIFRLEGEGAES